MRGSSSSAIRRERCWRLLPSVEPWWRCKSRREDPVAAAPICALLIEDSATDVALIRGFLRESIYGDDQAQSRRSMPASRGGWNSPFR
jgi:hypothetical protein